MSMWEPGVKKRVLYAGTGDVVDYQEGTKAVFHYETCKLDEPPTVLDDSRTQEKPMELIFGKKFKLEIWEKCLMSMRVGEVAEFICEPKVVVQYPVVAKSLRDIRQGKQDRPRHCCGMASDNSLGYPDLDQLVKNPQPLAFIIELIKVEKKGEYSQEAWQMTPEEKKAALPRLQEEGNNLYKLKQFHQAADKYAEALGCIEQLLIREKPGDADWMSLDNRKIPLLLNYAQCKLILGDYYPVIEHTTTVLTRDERNVKAYFRRGKAHAAVWNEREAQADFSKVLELDASLKGAVRKELKLLEDRIKSTEKEEWEKLKGKNVFG
ncbi:Aryl-hydrocarbon-interacting protein-like 1 [Branchiostoma belcheri]|nr:Aryl-hydrocarbon-interacting protein-like 1 [Branchiostoma belcheri]